MLYYYTGFLMVLHKLSSLLALKRQKENASAGAYAPRTLRTSVLKKRPPCQLFFAVHTSPEVYFIDTVC